MNILRSQTEPSAFVTNLSVDIFPVHDFAGRLRLVMLLKVDKSIALALSRLLVRHNLHKYFVSLALYHHQYYRVRYNLAKLLERLRQFLVVPRFGHVFNKQIRKLL